MLPLFTEQIRNGGPITVTDPEVTRFFMTIPEACQLVVQAGAIGRGGEVLILDMGEAVKILDVAQRMIAMSGKDIDIVFTGLRPGEKMHEDLIGVGEDDSRPLHPKISHTSVAPLDPGRLSLQQWKSEGGFGQGRIGALAGGTALGFLLFHVGRTLDRRAAFLLLAVAAGYVPWLLFPDRTIFFFYAIVFLPFLVIDLVAASLLMSLGMMMLPPSVVALPFKIIFFVMVDGWRLVSASLVQGFAGS